MFGPSGLRTVQDCRTRAEGVVVDDVAGVFVGRGAESARLAALVSGPGGRVVVVHGPDGVGKSALVARFARAHADRFSLVRWLSADSGVALSQGLADLGAALGPVAADDPLGKRAQHAFEWLTTHSGWLLVLDDLSVPEVLAGLARRFTAGTIVVTSSRATGWEGVPTVAPGPLAPDEAAELVTRIVRERWPAADLRGVERVCEELGRWPLAVEQAAAHLAHTRTTPAGYLDRLAAYPARAFTARDDAELALTRAWHVTFEELAHSATACLLLHVLAWFAPGDVPREVITAAQDPGGRRGVADAMDLLAAFGLITLTEDTITVHRSVQAVTRTPDPARGQRHPGGIAAARHRAFAYLRLRLTGPPDPEAWPTYREVARHAAALLDLAPPEDDTAAACGLFDLVGSYLVRQGDTDAAVGHLTRAVVSGERVHGPDHPLTSLARDNLALVTRTVGSEVDRRAAFADHAERTFGPDHPNTVSARSNLAAAHDAAGDHDRAIALYEEVLADSVRVLGPDHPDTLITRNNLAGVYLAAGDFARAIPLHEEALADRERVLGPEHPNTLMSRNNLAGAYLDAGYPDRAVATFQAVLTDCERILGPDHRLTVGIRNNLSVALRL
ncbi:tetratricopeptide repeat protein [Actinosynnema sp. NPDC020468]|uniref:tetratricopeptide repeat protein n=1 Tax=Actinosynnema sp. NPDC020468 TaxID=3154488 RepID=UPI0033CC07DA